jgi:hypothetical protein
VAVARYAIEISLQDEPGALGAVASLIGAAGADVIDVDVLEHGRGRVRDELTVELTGPTHAEDLARQLAELPGVEVEQIAPVGEYGHHLLVDALQVANAMIEESTMHGMLEALADGCMAAFGASWAVVVSEGRDRPLAAAGGVPPASVTRAGGGGLRFVGSDDCLALPITTGRMSLVVGREGWPFRNRERRELTTLSHICATRLEQLRDPAGGRADTVG